MVKKIDWDYFFRLCSMLAAQIKSHQESRKKRFTTIYGIPSGGSFVARELSLRLQIKLVDHPVEGTLIVDDLVDSGKTLTPYTEYHTAVLFVKPHTLFTPSMFVQEVSDWVEFPYENTQRDIEDNVVRLLEYIGEDPNREGLEKVKIGFEKGNGIWSIQNAWIKIR